MGRGSAFIIGLQKGIANTAQKTNLLVQWFIVHDELLNIKYTHLDLYKVVHRKACYSLVYIAFHIESEVFVSVH